jgi:hypothetical protein
MQQAQMEAQMAQAEMQQQGKQNVAEINAEAGLAKQEMQQMPQQMEDPLGLR